MPLKKQIIFQTTFATYAAIDVLGQGGAGIVYKCQDDNGNLLALKLLGPQNVTKERLKRFKNEVSFCKQNDNQNVLTVLDDGPYLQRDKVLPFYVMPLYDFSLRDLLK